MSLNIETIRTQVLLLIFGLFHVNLIASTLTTEENKTAANVNEPYKIELKLSRDDYACGLLVDWGDGTVNKHRIGKDQDSKSPYTYQHTYLKEGKFSIKAYGETIFRGMRTVAACPENLTIKVTVIDPAVEEQRLAQKKITEEENDRRKAQVEEEKQHALVRQQQEKVEREKNASLQKAEVLKKFKSFSVVGACDLSRGYDMARTGADQILRMMSNGGFAVARRIERDSRFPCKIYTDEDIATTKINEEAFTLLYFIRGRYYGLLNHDGVVYSLLSNHN